MQCAGPAVQYARRAGVTALLALVAASLAAPSVEARGSEEFKLEDPTIPGKTVVREFAYVGADKVWQMTVPSGVKALRVALWGATGGKPTGSDQYYQTANWGGDGLGDRLVVIVPATPGARMRIFVGGAGQRRAGGWNGGGGGGYGEPTESGGMNGAGGGGATDLRNAPYELGDRIVVAAGGGGGGGAYGSNGGGWGGSSWETTNARDQRPGGDGAGTCVGGKGGGPGSKSEGGSAGKGGRTSERCSDAPPAGTSGESGSRGSGGSGGAAVALGTSGAGGGGGGGWYGGGGGGGGQGLFNGGGGGTGSTYAEGANWLGNRPGGKGAEPKVEAPELFRASPGGNDGYAIVSWGDELAPKVSMNAPAKKANLRRDSTVAAAYRCTDAAGVAKCEATAVAPVGAPGWRRIPLKPGDAVPTYADGRWTIELTAADKLGNARRTTRWYQVDGTAPTVRVESPDKNGVYALGGRLVASYRCRDEGGGSGLASCRARLGLPGLDLWSFMPDVPSGSTIATHIPGLLEFVVQATDRAGNLTIRRVPFTVRQPAPQN